jgi:cell division topological specificity factor
MGLLDLFKKKGSSDVAKDRLKLLLVSDRANCSPEVMEMIKSFLSLEKVPKPDDTADALALAVCHANYSGTDYSRLYKEAGR